MRHETIRGSLSRFEWLSDRGVVAAGSVCRVRQGVGSGSGDVQSRSVRTDRDAGQHDLHPDSDERRPIPRYLPPTAMTFTNYVQWSSPQDRNDLHIIDLDTNDLDSSNRDSSDLNNYDLDTDINHNDLESNDLDTIDLDTNHLDHSDLDTSDVDIVDRYLAICHPLQRTCKPKLMIVVSWLAALAFATPQLFIFKQVRRLKCC